MCKGFQVFLHLQLLDHASESLKDFLLEKNISLEKKHPLAFTFSFPCEHSALDKVMTLSCSILLCTYCRFLSLKLPPLPLQALLLNWSKNYRAWGLLGKDVIQSLRQAIDRTGVGPFDVTADTMHSLLFGQ